MKRLLLVAVCVMALGSSGTVASQSREGAVTASDHAEAERAYEALVDGLARGEFTRVEEDGRRFLRVHARDPLAPRAAVVVCEAVLFGATGGRPSLATDLAAIDPTRLSDAGELLVRFEPRADGPTRDRITLYRAYVLALSGRREEALAQLLPLRPSLVAVEDRRLLEWIVFGTSLGEAAPTALQALDALRRDCRGDEECALVDQRTATLLESLPAEEIRTLALGVDTSRHSFVALASRAIAIAAEAADFETIRAVFARANAGGVRLDPASTTIAGRLERGLDADPATIGVIAPLSGPDAPIGIAIVEAVARAAGLPPEGRIGAGQPRIVTRDSRGMPDVAARGVSELFFLHRAIAIVGPPDAASSARCAERASTLGVPYLSLVPVPSAPYVHVVVTAQVTSLEAVARSRRRGSLVAVAPSSTAMTGDTPVVRHAGGRLTRAARAELLERAPDTIVVLGRADQAARAAVEVARAFRRSRRAPRIVLERASYVRVTASERSLLEGALVVDLGAASAASDGESSRPASLAATAFATVVAAHADDRAELEAHLARDGGDAAAVAVFRVERGALIAESP